MAIEIPKEHPETLVAGDTLKFQIEPTGDYTPENGWAMAYFIRGNGTQMAQKYTSSPDSGNFIFEVAARDTVEWTVGKYRFEAYVFKDMERHRVDYGDFEIKPDFQTGNAALDTRTDNQKALDAINAVINGTASVSARQFQIGGKSIERFSLKELQEAQTLLERKVAKEKQIEKDKRDGTNSSLIKVHLS